MPVILLKRDGLHDIVRLDLVSSRLNGELNGLVGVPALLLIDRPVLLNGFL